MSDCTECGVNAAWEISWSPVWLPVYSCDGHLPEMCRAYSIRRVKERPQDGDVQSVHLTSLT